MVWANRSLAIDTLPAFQSDALCDWSTLESDFLIAPAFMRHTTPFYYLVEALLEAAALASDLVDDG